MNSPVADQVTAEPEVTDYDRAHLKTYTRLLDADANGATWQEPARLILGIDPVREPVRAQVSYESHLARAKWMAEGGYLALLKSHKP